eukprot:bmy_14173T0
MRDLVTSQKQACWQKHIRKETAAQVAWNISCGHKHLKEGPLPRKRLQKAPFSSPDCKEVPVGWPETRGLQDQLSRGVGVQGPPPKGDRVRQARRATRGLAGQTKPGGLGMKQVPPHPAAALPRHLPRWPRPDLLPPGAASAEAGGEVSVLGVQQARGFSPVHVLLGQRNNIRENRAKQTKKMVTVDIGRPQEDGKLMFLFLRPLLAGRAVTADGALAPDMKAIVLDCKRP